MTWIDLAALVIVFWGAVKGYIYGMYFMFLHLCGLAAALVCAIAMHRPLASFLVMEWRAESFFVGFFTKHVEHIAETGFSRQGLRLPALTGQVMRALVPEAETLPVLSGEAAIGTLSRIIVRFLALTVFFLFLAMVLTLLLRITSYKKESRALPEWQRFLGMAFGMLQGLTLAVLTGIALDTISLFFLTDFLKQDYSASCLYAVTSAVLQRLLP